MFRPVSSSRRSATAVRAAEATGGTRRGGHREVARTPHRLFEDLARGGHAVAVLKDELHAEHRSAQGVVVTGTECHSLVNPSTDTEPPGWLDVMRFDWQQHAIDS
ncbi:hypothetical protein Cs7R123_78650 [Catellatospora sp. TT07R-123]|nr:hypothetical protein Cs7R123_78650 [Catellatospora sp. TT07R-123]